jgi:glutathione S-transferase
MKLYILTGACSLASNIALREAGIKFDLAKVDRHTKRTDDGVDFAQVNPKGYVPALRLDNGEVLTENVAVLQYIADLNPAAQLAPPVGTLERFRLLEWLSFINSEVHKAFSPMFSPQASEDTKQFARANVAKRCGWLDGVFGSKPFIMGEQFTVADAYLFTALGWGTYVNVDISQWPKLKSHHERVGARPHVREALKSEGLLKA